MLPGPNGEIIVPAGADSCELEWTHFYDWDIEDPLEGGAWTLVCRLDFHGDGTCTLTETDWYLDNFDHNSAWLGVNGEAIVSWPGNSGYTNPPDIALGRPTSALITGLTPGQELILECYDIRGDTSYADPTYFLPRFGATYYSGPSTRNPDYLNHCKWRNVEPGGTGGNHAF